MNRQFKQENPVLPGFWEHTVLSEFTIRRTPRYDCSRLVAEADVTENEVDTGEDDDGDVMYMSGSHPAVDYESVQFDVDLGDDSEDDGVRTCQKFRVYFMYRVTMKALAPEMELLSIRGQSQFTPKAAWDRVIPFPVLKIS